MLDQSLPGQPCSLSPVSGMREVTSHLLDAEAYARVRGQQIADDSARTGLLIAGGDELPARAARPRLEEATLNDQSIQDAGFTPGNEKAGDVWTVTAIRYKSGLMQTRATLFGAWTHPRARSLVAGSVRTARPPSAERFDQSIKRSKRTLREKCFSLDADHMLTLTKRGKFSSVDELWRVFNLFNRLMTKLYKDRWQYVAVPELHADGETYHMHCAIHGHFWAGVVRKIWLRSLGGKGNETGTESPGNIDLKAFRKHRAGAAAIRRVAGYISKYVGKGFGPGSHSRRLYSSSRGLGPAEVQRFFIRDWLGVPQVATAIQRWLCGLGAAAEGNAFHWSRTRSSDEKLLAMGFVLTSFLPAR